VRYAALIGFGMGLLASPAAAELEVIESNARQYAVGMKLPDNATIRLKTGERVKVLMLPSMRTRVFTGASQGGKGPTGGTRSVKKPE
jgi:hypothetical protein